MTPYLTLTAQALIVVLGVIIFAFWLRRRLPVRWSTWFWGALAFVGSQAVRLPLLAGLTLLINPYFRDTNPNAPFVFWLNLVVLAGTSGLFEETARYVVLRWLAKGARSWDDGVMFGAGHGGIEAILVVGVFGAINALALLLLGDTLLARTRAVAPQQATALADQMAALRNLPWWTPAVAIYERVWAITLHIALSILVLRAVVERRLRWWAVAVVWHDLVNAIALIANRYGGIPAAEIALTVVSALSVWFIVWSRRVVPRTIGATPPALDR